MLSAETLVIVLAFLITVAATEAGSSAREAYVYPFDQPSSKWWFIRGDYVEGLYAAAGLLVALALYFWIQRTGVTTKTVWLWFPFSWRGGAALKALVIWLNCSQVMQPDLATTRWKSFTDYIDDP